MGRTGSASVSMHSETFITGRDATRSMDVFLPTGAESGPRPAVVLFHGGAWKFGDRSQFHPQCRRFAAAGIVAVTSEYDLGGTILDCVLDARAAFEHAVRQARTWNIAPTAIAVGGGSAGGHLAACLVTCPSVSPTPRPAAAVLYNPALAFADGMRALGELAPEVGTDPERISPLDQELAGLPPTLIFHGTVDRIVSIEHSRAFRDAATAAGVQCKLVEFEEREHGFFNPVPEEYRFVPNGGDFDATTDAASEFLARMIGPDEAGRVTSDGAGIADRI